MARHIQKRHRTWYATLDIPADVRAHFGGKRRFFKSLETHSEAQAPRKARQGLGVAGIPPISASGILTCPARIHPLHSAPTGGGSRTTNAFVNESGAHAELIGGLFDA